MSSKKNIPAIRFGGFSGEWAVKKNKDVCSISTGKSNTQDKVDNGKYPFFVRSSIVERSNKYLFNEEAVLTAGDGVGTGKVFHYVNERYDLHQRVYRMFDFNGVKGKYFYYYFMNHFYDRVMSMTAKSSVDSVRLDMISEMDIHLPSSLDEQTKIACAFANIDKLINQNDSKLEKLKSIKKAYLEKMFPKHGSTTPEIRFKGFSGDWEEVKFKELAIVRRGLTYKPSDVRSLGVRVLRSSNINEDTFCHSDSDVFVSKEAINIDYVNNGDILITSANGSSRLVGKHAIVDGLKAKTTVPGGFMLLASTNFPFFVNASMGSSWYNRFLYCYVSGGNGAIGNLSKSDLEEQIVPIPTEDEQKKIGNFFRNLDEQIAIQEQKLKKLTYIKKACLKKMFV